MVEHKIMSYRNFLGSILTPLAIFSILAVVFQFSSPNIPDPDSFYHLRHAEIYKEQGIFTTDFPWVQYSAISQLKSDLWYGFHILLIPFTYLNPIIDIKIAGVFLTSLALAIFYFVLKRHQTPLPFLWTILLFVSAPNTLNRLLMVRPHTLTLALSLLLLSLLIKGKNRQIVLISFLFSWVHLSLSWVPILIGIVVLTISRTKSDIIKLSYLFGGILMGWLARPNPIGAIKLAYIQVIQLMLEKQKNIPLLFGRELLPLSPQTLFENFTPLMIVWISAIAMLIAYLLKNKLSNQKIKTLIWSSLILSAIFFLMALFIARRSYDFWGLFAILFAALVFSIIKNSNHNTAKNIFIVIFIITLGFLMFYSPIKNARGLKQSAVAPDLYKEISLWLKNNSQPGDIVFNVRWSDFPMLFYWNKNNYYIGGMDPIFQYAYNPALYWKFHYLSNDDVTKKTCPAIECTISMLEDTHTVLVNDFKAKYIVLEKQRNPLVYYYLENDPGYEKKLDTKREVLYLIKP